MTLTHTATSDAEGHRRAVPVLVASQALGGVGVSSGIAVGGLLAQELSGSTSVAGLVQTATVLGAALLAVPLARLAGRSGRRPALYAGYLLGLLGALLVLASAVAASFRLLLLGALLFGGATAAGLQARYAATDAAPAQVRGRALSIVVWATTIGVVVGPNLSGIGADIGRAVGIPPLAGPYVFSAGAFALSAVVVLLALRPDPLSSRPPALSADQRPARPLGVRGALAVVVVRPPALLGFGGVCTAHAVMVGVMVMTPVQLVDHGFTLRVVGLVISLHVAGMYAASPVFGWMSDRLGRSGTILVGLVLLGASTATAGTAGPAAAQTGAGLLLLGLGWSACLVAGSTLVSESVPDAARTSVQGATDLVMGLAGAAAGAGAGVLLSRLGYGGMNAAAAALLLPVAALGVFVVAFRRPAGEVSGGGTGRATRRRPAVRP